MLYFLLTKLCVIDHMYQYSLDSFMTFFEKSVRKAPAKDDLQERVISLRDSLRISIFTWVSRGLFERHKLIFLAQLTFNLMKRGIIGTEDWNEAQFQFLIRAPTKSTDPNPLTWLPDTVWTATAALAALKSSTNLQVTSSRLHHDSENGSMELHPRMRSYRWMGRSRSTTFPEDACCSMLATRPHELSTDQLHQKHSARRLIIH